MGSKVQKIVRLVIKSILDSLEDCLDSFVVAKGKQTVLVLFVCVGFLAVSVVLEILNVYSFISWQEAAVAVGFMLFICSMSYTNKILINKIFKFINKNNEKGEGM